MTGGGEEGGGEIRVVVMNKKPLSDRPMMRPGSVRDRERGGGCKQVVVKGGWW